MALSSFSGVGVFEAFEWADRNGGGEGWCRETAAKEADGAEVAV